MDCDRLRLHCDAYQPLKCGHEHIHRQARANCVVYAEVHAHARNGFRKPDRIMIISNILSPFVLKTFNFQVHIHPTYSGKPSA